MRIGTFHEFEPIDYLVEGKHCVDVAFLLKDGQDKMEKNYPMRNLLALGIELLLKGVIQKYNARKFNEIKKKSGITHNIEKLYEIASEVDRSNNLNILTNNELKSAIFKHTSKYYPDTVKARYTNTDSFLDFTLFIILRELLIQPLEKIIHL